MDGIVNYLIVLFLIFLITVVILVLIIVYYCMKMQDSKTEELRRSLRRVERGAGRGIAARSTNRNTVHAITNEYLSQPTQRAPQRRSLNSSFFSDFDLPEMRFYTPEELLHYPFERHERALSAMIAAAEQNSGGHNVSQSLRSQNSDHLAMPPPSVSENVSRRLSAIASPAQSPSSPKPFSENVFSFQSETYVQPPPIQSPVSSRILPPESNLYVIPEETRSIGSRPTSEQGPQYANIMQITPPPCYQQKISSDFVNVPL